MRILYTIYATAIIFLLWNAVGDTSAKEMAVNITLVLWCAGLIWVIFKIKWFELVALLAFVPVIGLLLFQFINRVSFLIEHDGMDCVTCNGSPMAFLMGWVTEAVFLLPGGILCLWFFRCYRPNVASNEI